MLSSISWQYGQNDHIIGIWDFDNVDYRGLDLNYRIFYCETLAIDIEPRVWIASITREIMIESVPRITLVPITFIGAICVVRSNCRSFIVTLFLSLKIVIVKKFVIELFETND